MDGGLSLTRLLEQDLALLPVRELPCGFACVVRGLLQALIERDGLLSSVSSLDCHRSLLNAWKLGVSDGQVL
jgi:hypothetical protein